MAKIALLIGVSEYESGLNPLPGSVLDVDAMQRVLVHPEMGGFAAADITVLKNPQRQVMEEAIDWLFSDRKKDDLLLFYFSGHGIKDEYANYYLATRATCKKNDRLHQPSAIRAADLHRYMETSRSHYQVIILDACFSGAFPQGMTVVKDDGIVNLQAALGGKGRAILTSSSSVEYSFSADATSYEETKLSVYTRYLVEGIETGAADTDDDGAISVEELHDYASSRVKEAAPAMTSKLYPVEEGYKIIVAKSPKNDPKLRYRKQVQTKAEQGQGKFDSFARALLEGNRKKWVISLEDAEAIEHEVLQPYREYEEKLHRYEQTLKDAVKSEYPFSAIAQSNLKEYQQYLALREADISEIAGRVVAPVQAKYEQQQAAEQQWQKELEQQRQTDLEHKQQAEAQKNQQPTETESSPQTPVTTEPEPVRWKFWIRWISATFLGMLIAAIFTGFLSGAIAAVTNTKDEAGVVGLVAILLFPFLIGLIQWLAIRKEASGSIYWLLVLCICSLLGMGSALSLQAIAGSFGSGVVLFILFPALSGSMVLRFLPKLEN